MARDLEIVTKKRTMIRSMFQSKIIRIIPIFIIFLFTLPFLTLISKLGLAGNIDAVDFFWALENTIYQSFFSSSFILFFGIWGALGLLFLEKRIPKHYTLFEGVFLIPNLLPSLFIILSSLYIISPFPFGRPGIILIHTLINIGLASFTIKNLIKNKIGQMVELALVEGASFWQFLWYGIITFLKRELFFIFLFFFATCFTSFQIPLVVGANSGTTIEVLIYEKILIDNDLSQALSLTLIQSFSVFVLSYFARVSTNPPTYKDTQYNLIAKGTGLIFPAIATLIVLVAPLKAIPHGIEQIQAIDFPFTSLPPLLLQSLIIGISTGVFVWTVGSLTAFYSEHYYLQKFFQSYLAPSPVIMGVFIYSISFVLKPPSFLSLAVILGLLWFSGLYRLYIAPSLSSLKSQIQVAKTLGASQTLIFTAVIFPQIASNLGRAAALAALWAIGEFALSGFISSSDFHLAMVIKTLSSHYRLSAALLLSWILLAVGLICYFFFIGVSRVISRKSVL
jgi:thiamine transport system permease protein